MEQGHLILGVQHQALALLRQGARNIDVARQLGVPAGTVGYWLHMERAARGQCPGQERAAPCPRCRDRELDAKAYSYLLGQYLGDGHVSRYSGHRVPNLMITCADDWPGVADETEAAMRSVFPRSGVCRVRRSGCHNIKVYAKHLPCLFPQHGPGKKHDRLIALEPWQREITDLHPWPFVRGLIHSDGCRVTNWTVRTVAGEPKRYEYPRYLFTNKSADIMRLFTDTLDALGVEWKPLRQRTHAPTVSVARRASVALMDRHVGPKY